MFPINIDPIRPYLWLIKLSGVLLLAAFAFTKGCSYGEGTSAAEHAKAIAKKNAVIAAKDLALNDAAASLRGAAGILRNVEAESQRRITEAAEAKKAAAAAGAAAARAEQRLEASFDRFAKALAHAKRSPDCDALLSADVRATCGL